MVIHVIGCGETAKNWDGSGMSIGINDAWRHKPTNCLVVSNFPNKFPQERLNIIKNSKPVKFYSPLNSWRQYFLDMTEIKLRSWDGHLYDKTVINTQTSASIAMDLSRQLGATKIVLWGIEYRTHATFHPGNPQTYSELRQLEAIVRKFREVGVQVYLGSKGSELEKFLTVYDHSHVNA